GAIERISQAGITKIAAIHRGFHSPQASSFRNKPQWNLAIELKRLLPELPMICDPSHICGNTELIPFVAQKALDLDMAGLMLETHIHPELAWSDAKQQVTPDQLSEIMENLTPRNPNVTDESGINLLGELRENINKLDTDILQIMSDRMLVAKKIGEYKKDNGVTVLQVARWDEILNSRISAGQMLGLEKEFVTKLYSLIHKESIDVQNKLMNI
ncbi:MAG: chorismate mutase, partial [Bacteroidota bacterium]